VDALAQAKANFLSVVNHPYPQGLTVSDWWTERKTKFAKAISDFESVGAVIHSAQNNSGFDHRVIKEEKKLAVVNYKLSELRAQFPGVDLLGSPGLRESSFSIPESLVPLSADLNVSSISLTHFYFYLRSFCCLPLSGHRRVLEIGTGYGGLSRIFRLEQRDLTYVLVDLPESLFCAEVFIRANFPDAKIFYCEFKDCLPDIDQYDFVFVPAQNVEVLTGLSFNLVINTGSLQEMTESSVFFWMRFIQETIKTDYFYSWNYFLNPKYLLPEAGPSLISPVLDPRWSVQYFKINNPVISVDCCERNWLEVCLSRIKLEGFDRLDYTNKLITVANGFPMATNYWFANIWMAIWTNPAPGLIEAMLEGIKMFNANKAFHVMNHLTDENEFSETEFYKKLLDKVKSENP
jgi:hypothetical protein